MEPSLQKEATLVFNFTFSSSHKFFALLSLLLLFAWLWLAGSGLALKLAVPGGGCYGQGGGIVADGCWQICQLR